MSFYWIYDLPNWLLCSLIVASTVGLSLAGLFISRPIVKRIAGASSEHNDLVSYFLGAMGVFYGLALGLIAVATWENYTEVDADIKRVLDSATGAFHDDFQNRSQPFVEVVKKVQSKSEGTIAEAGLLSYTKDQAQVLVAVSVKTSMAAAPADQEPRRWRMRLTVDKTGDSAKVSNVEFVP